MNNAISITDAYEVCRRVTFKHAKTFYFASRFIKPQKRNACYAIYAFCRYVDDIVDVAMEQGNVTQATAIKLVEQWRSDVGHLYDGNATTADRSHESRAVLTAWEHTLEHYHIDRHLPEELIEGVLMDTTVRRFATFDDLREYCYKVASVVGLMTSEVFGMSSNDAIPHAVDLGIAMQLTNIIRDVAEDARMDRIYLPQEELARFGVNEESILRCEFTEPFRQMMVFNVERAHEYYRSGDAGIHYLASDSRLTVQLMSTNYRKILGVVESMNYNVFTRRASTSTFQKVASIPRAISIVRGMRQHD